MPIAARLPAAPAFYLAAGGTNLANDPARRRRWSKAGPNGLALLPKRQGDAGKGRDLADPGARTARRQSSSHWLRGILAVADADLARRQGQIISPTSAPSATMPAGYEGNLKAMNDFQDAETAEGGSRHRASLPDRRRPRRPSCSTMSSCSMPTRARSSPTRRCCCRTARSPAIGAAGSIPAPAGARTIDGRGKTLVPGLWDSHMHIGDDWNVLTNMATGITSFRSPGTDDRPGASTRPSGANPATC